MDGIGGTLKNAVYRDVKSGKTIINDVKEFAELADKTIKGISSLCILSDNVIIEQEEIKTAPKIPEALKSINLCAPWRKEKILRFTSVT